MTVQALPYILLLGFLFGSTLVVSRFSVGQFHPTTYIGLRMVLASLSYVAIFTLVPQRHKWPTDLGLWGHAALLGVFGTAIPMVGIVSSLVYLSSGMTAVLITSGPAITVLIAHFALTDETLTWRKSVGIVLALSGALLLALRGETGLPDIGRSTPIGYGLVLVSMVCGGAMTVYARKFMRQYDAFQVSSIRMFVAMLVVMPLSALYVGVNLQNVNSQGYFALVYAALVGTFGGFLLAFYNVKRFGATTAAMVQFVIPIVAGFGGVLLLNETITRGMSIGTALIVIGVAIINQW